MNVELDQQQKFTDQFLKLIEDAPLKFKNKWDNNIEFLNPSRKKFVPSFSAGVLEALPVELRNKYEILRGKYYAKSLL